MHILSYIIIATFVNGLLGLIGIFTLNLKAKLLDRVIFGLVAISAGSLLGGGFFHLFLESLDNLSSMAAISYLMLGFVTFYLLEKFLFWHHCHESHCNVHPFSYLILVGDVIHNIIDGLIIAASFFVNIKFGILTTFMIMSHELPQELGNFAILVYGGFSRMKAIFYSFLAQLVCVLGGILGYFIGSTYNKFLLPIAAGGFIYIAASDLIPELHKQKDIKKSAQSFVLFLVGLFIMIGFKFLFE